MTIPVDLDAAGAVGATVRYATIRLGADGCFGSDATVTVLGLPPRRLVAVGNGPDGRNAPSPSDRIADALQCAHGGVTVLVTDRWVKVDGGLRIAYYIGADATTRANQGMTGCYYLRGGRR